jgi:hypothetical protein
MNRIFWTLAFVMVGCLCAYAAWATMLPYLNRNDDTALLWGVLGSVLLLTIICLLFTTIIRSLWRN